MGSSGCGECVRVCEWRKWDVHGAGLDYSDARPSYFNLFTEPRTPRRMFENFGSGHWLESSKRNRGAAVEADVIGEQQLKRTQSGCSSRSGRDREQQLKWMQAASSRWGGRNQGAAAGSGGKGGAAVEADAAIGPGSSSWSADASGEQQLKRT